jgi:putative heme-binding domain-containing protein
MSYQTIPEPYLTGPWHAERMWHLPNKGQPAWIVPPVGKLGAGPSGFVFTSGLSLPERYRNKFFYCNYTGNGGVESFGVVPHGAGFAMVDHHDFLKPIMATDVDFGYDGKMYVADFVNLDWTGKSLGGRIYTLFDPKRLDDPIVQETKRLFVEGFSRRSEKDLAKLLDHADLRVRQRAQFALAERGEKSIPIFQMIARSSKNQLARLHAIWGLGQIGRKHPEACQMLATWLQDPDAEVRAQSARVIGDCNWSGANRELLEAIGDASPRVRFFATMALGKLKVHAAIKPIAAMLKANDNEDPFLRHAGVTALASIGDANAVLGLVYYGSSAVRMASLLALRRLNDQRLVRFLGDGVFEIATEAARAINDLPIEADFPELSRLLDRYATNSSLEAEPLLRRAINANLRLGLAANAERVIRFAANERANPTMRAEALAALADWAQPSPRDRVTGYWRPLPPRDPKVIRGVLQDAIPAILSSTSGRMQADAIRLVTRYELKIDDASFFKWVGDQSKHSSARVAALHLLAARKNPRLEQAIDIALHDSSPRLRAEARSLWANVRPEAALPRLVKVLNDSSASPLERQSALAVLAKAQGGEKLIEEWAGRLKAGQVPNVLMVDLLEILKESPDAKRKQLASEWESKQSPSDPLAKFRIALHGGDAERGRALFVGHAAAQCMRCHKIHNEGGDAGPDLSKVVERNPNETREYLLESLIVPSAKIAQGYANVSLTLTSGKIAAGLIKSEDAKSVTLLTPTGKILAIAKSDIEERTSPVSAMPEMGRVLSPREIRDLIEYLMTLK